ncbi:MAG: hypothetical protein A3G70_05740 [Planctomycetes bacterium RIFCSPLOWO2_12_FULL_39_13]|nr:MAG: hypothetical protein A3G70_05740 [Planctomycetes bacterium RIFCSPLOWO2_12_FULL_39_13]
MQARGLNLGSTVTATPTPSPSPTPSPTPTPGTSLAQKPKIAAGEAHTAALKLGLKQARIFKQMPTASFFDIRKVFFTIINLF